MRLSKLGEFGLIRRIAKNIKVDESVFCGIGDDCAVIKYGAKYLLFTTDMLIEGVHFKMDAATPLQIGRKSLAVNISDIAAMGGIPRYAVVAVSLPNQLQVEFIDKLYKGITGIAKEFKVNIVGGDTNRSGKLTICISLIGEVEKDNLVRRSGAKTGDKIFVTGSLGGSICAKHLNFTPRVKESRALVNNFKINSMIDLSDGVASDLRHICEQSDVGARIYEGKIPLSKYAKGIKSALCDGEDFELLFTASAKEAEKIEQRWSSLSKTRLTCIGEIMPKKFGIKLVDAQRRIKNAPCGGYAHF